MKDTQKAQTLQLVKRMISRSLNNKQVGWSVENAVLHNSPITPADCYPLVNQIAVGTADYNRIGERIRPRALRVRGTIALNGSSITGGFTHVPIQVRVMILSEKDIKTAAQVLGGAVDTLRLLKPNIQAADEVDYSGATFNALLPVNKELFHVYYDKTFTLCGPEPEGVEQLTRFQVNWSKTITKLPASLTFDNGNGDYINNFAPFLAIGYSYPDGSSPDTVSQRIVSTTFSQLTYEDA